MTNEELQADRDTYLEAYMKATEASQVLMRQLTAEKRNAEESERGRKDFEEQSAKAMSELLEANDRAERAEHTLRKLLDQQSDPASTEHEVTVPSFTVSDTKSDAEKILESQPSGDPTRVDSPADVQLIHDATLTVTPPERRGPGRPPKAKP